jgi:hypothetical protein
MLEIDIESQNICCDIVLRILNDKEEGLPLTYRHLVKERIWDDYCKLQKIPDIQSAFNKLDESITIPFHILTELKYKYKCSELCPFPTCLDDLHAWEFELITNYEIIANVLSWSQIGMPLTKVAQWHSVSIENCRRWINKRKKIQDREETYKGFLPYIQYIPKMVK